MIKRFIQEIMNADNPYGGIGMMLALYFVCFLFIYFYSKDSKMKKAITLPSILLIGFLYILVPFLDVFVRSMSFYDGRFFWMLMTPIITALGFTLFVKGIDEKKLRILAIVLLIPVIFYSGKFAISNAYYQKAENEYRLPQSTVDITEYMLERNESPVLICPYTIAHPFRQISTKVRLMFGEDAKSGRIISAPDELWHICWEMERKIPNIQRIIDESEEYSPDYIIFDTIYTELCENGNININNYPPDENYVAERTGDTVLSNGTDTFIIKDITYDQLPGITVVGTEEELYWDLSNYGLTYEKTFGHYILYSFDK